MSDFIDNYQKFASEAHLEKGPEAGAAVIGFALGLAGEAGEVCDDIKKKYYHQRPINDEHTIEELGDVMWYVANLATAYGVKLSDIIRQNEEKLRKRYAKKY